MESAQSQAAGALVALRVAATAVFALALPLFLVTSGVRWIALGERFYVDEFAKYQVGRVTGLSDAQLRQVAEAFVAYFQSEPKAMEVTIQQPDGPRALFNDRELVHMVDVQSLIRRVFQVWTAALVALAIAVAGIIAAGPVSSPPALARAGAIGGGIAVLLVGVLGAASLLDFGQIFFQFHLLSFSNDLWLLDPRRDRLIQLFPQGFFLDAALRIAVQTVAAGAVVFAISLATLRVK